MMTTTVLGSAIGFAASFILNFLELRRERASHIQELEDRIYRLELARMDRKSASEEQRGKSK